MTPWTLLERADDPDGTRLELLQRGPHFSIRVNGQLLMNSRVHDSERSLAELALAALGAREPSTSVLVGGLGFGYTLSAVLERLDAQASVLVVEIAPAVVRWNRERLAELNGGALADPRVMIVEGDLCQEVRGERVFDVILLDVDNGPRAVERPGNTWLYTPEGLAALRASLAPGGVLAIWSAGPEVGFSERVRDAGFEVTLHRVRSHAARTGERHFIWVGKKI
jgi:spermidine synthase